MKPFEKEIIKAIEDGEIKVENLVIEYGGMTTLKIIMPLPDDDFIEELLKHSTCLK
jgi:hypothetical protein